MKWGKGKRKFIIRLIVGLKNWVTSGVPKIGKTIRRRIIRP